MRVKREGRRRVCHFDVCLPAKKIEGEEEKKKRRGRFAARGIEFGQPLSFSFFFFFGDDDDDGGEENLDVKDRKRQIEEVRTCLSLPSGKFFQRNQLARSSTQPMRGRTKGLLISFLFPPSPRVLVPCQGICDYPHRYYYYYNDYYSTPCVMWFEWVVCMGRAIFKSLASFHKTCLTLFSLFFFF